MNRNRVFQQNRIYKQEPLIDLPKIIKKVSNTIEENQRKQRLRQQQRPQGMSLLEKIIRLNELAKQPRQEHRFSQIHEEMSEYKKQINELKSELHNEVGLIKEDVIRLKEERINILEKNVSELQETLYNMLKKKGISEEELVKYLENYKISHETHPKFNDLIDKVEKLSIKQEELEQYKADLDHLKRMNLDNAKDTTLN